MINQENTAAGSYPELSQAVMAGTEFINEQLGGVNGHPLEIDVCNTEFSAEGSTSCGQQFVEAKVPAVLGGIDVFGNGIETLAENDIPFIGGIPVSFASVRSPNSFQWSGGSWGASVAFAWYAAEELDAKKVSIVYADFGSITDSAEDARDVLEARDVDAQLVPYPVMATDISSALNAAAATKPDAVFIMAADSGCKAGYDGLAALGLDATAFYTGACAAPSIVAEAGPKKTNGAIYNVEGPVGQKPPNPDMAFYSAVIEQYGDGLDPIGAGTVSFRSLMNLYAIMNQIDGEITPEATYLNRRAFLRGGIGNFSMSATSWGGAGSSGDGGAVIAAVAVASRITGDNSTSNKMEQTMSKMRFSTCRTWPCTKPCP